MANKIFISGNVGKDLELTYTSGKGTAVGKFSVAVNEYNSQTKQNDTMWVNVTIFGKVAESLSPYLVKGTKVIVTGKLSIRKYTANDGIEKQSVEIIADSFGGIELVGSKSDKGTFEKNHGVMTDTFKPDESYGEPDDTNDNIPF